MAREYGEELGLSDTAELAGQFHDFGKYAESFQELIKSLRPGQRIDHALPGAALLAQKSAYKAAALAVAGHHDGLSSFTSLNAAAKDSIKESTPIETTQRKTVSLAGQQDYGQAVNLFRVDHPDWKGFPKLPKSSGSMLEIRMLFSCLVDADYTVSASEEGEAPPSAPDLKPTSVLSALYAHRDNISATSTADSNLNRIRDEVFMRCGSMGGESEGVFTLTAPTGTGKTLALLHFALRHCQRWKKKRIILVLPYLSLTEQSSKEYKAICPDVLLDDSRSELSDEERLYASRWDAPLIVTTSVRFFESLFSNLPGDCRKLHRVANSVVVFDESQTLPAELTAETMRMVQELSSRFHTTFLFSTATQPDYTALPGLKWQSRELIDEPAALYAALRRTRVAWRTQFPTALSAIADEMAEQDNVCAVMNLRVHARKLYGLLKERNDEGLFFLSTDLCTAERSAIVEEIKTRQKNDLPCRVVATQCIEAGVDLDFSSLYRALAPLEAIVQAAGRCNRNGKQKEGIVTVFVPDEPGQLYPGESYEHAAHVVELMINNSNVDIHDPTVLRDYYERYFRDCKEKQSLQDSIRIEDFEKTHKAYKLINDSGLQVIVPYGEVYAAMAQELRERGMDAVLRRKCASLQVAVPLWQREKLLTYAEPVYERRKSRDGERLESPFFLLRPQYENLYETGGLGLQLPEKKENLDLFA
ncbi:MAG: CRISPR-associated endonuclease Cas3'' [Clostridiales bacterium]|nr:CRISPR-associated endonuclease Cas3'' [Candidatus Apopatocola equi]